MMKQNDGESRISIWREAAMATSLGWDIAIPIFGGVLLGYFLDRWLKTGYVFTIGLLFLGTIVSFYNLLRFAQQMMRQEQARKTREEERQKENS
jgi:predicted F0F1-ATPase subunit